MKWIFSLFVFLLPLYILRFPLYVGSQNVQMPFLEIAAYGIAAFVFLQDARGNIRIVKIFFGENPLFFVGFIFLWAGLVIGLFQSNSAAVSLGIVRGWFFAPCAWFLALVAVQKKEFFGGFVAAAFVGSAAIVSALALLFPHFNQDTRITGFYGSPNYLAMYVAPLIPFIVYQAYCAYKKFFAPRDAFEMVRKYGWFFLLGLCFIAIGFSASFGALLGIMVAGMGVAVLWLLRFHKKFFLPIVLSTSALTAIGVAAFHARIIEKIHSRLGLWHAAWNMGTSHPLFGIGEGMFQTAYQTQKHLIPYPVPLESALHPHNIFLTFWLYAGLFGLIGFFCVLVWFGQKIYKRLKQQPDDFFAVAIACSFIIILTHGLVDTTYWKNDLAFMWWTLMALLI